MNESILSRKEIHYFLGFVKILNLPLSFGEVWESEINTACFGICGQQGEVSRATST